MSDPKLKEAMSEIIGVMKKHDIGGCITLVSESHSEFRYRLGPSWSVVNLQSDGFLRFRSKRADFKTLEEQHRCTELSVHLLSQIRDINALSFKNMNNILDILNDCFEIKHAPFSGFEPHREN